LCQGERGGRNERSLEKRNLKGVEGWFLRKNEVLLKVKKKGKTVFRGKKKGLRSPKKWCFIREL